MVAVPLVFRFARRIIFALVFLFATGPMQAYSLLTHEQLIDLTWKSSITPFLLSRYPGLTAAQLEEARAYAYGGCVIQDIGYYPFGDRFFSDLTHYVRSGDFVANLFRTARSANEMAFAVGALSHYIGDTVGHPEATNRAVAVEFPKLRAKFGPVVTYSEGERAHVQTEFAFDINEIAHRRFAPSHYLKHVGLGVPTRQVGDAFYMTYGLGEDFSERRSRRVNVRGYEFAVRRFIPRIAYAVTLLHRHNMPADSQTADFLRLEKELQRVASENNWDQYRKKPGLGTYSLAALIYVLPKIGPLKLVAIKGPTAATEEEYVRSVNQSTDALASALAGFGRHAGRLDNRDLDTGSPTRPGTYRLADKTYASLVERIASDPKRKIPSGLKKDVLSFYASSAPSVSTKKDSAAWARVEAGLAVIRAMDESDEPPVGAAE